MFHVEQRDVCCSTWNEAARAVPGCLAEVGLGGYPGPLHALSGRFRLGRFPRTAGLSPTGCSPRVRPSGGCPAAVTSRPPGGPRGLATVRARRRARSTARRCTRGHASTIAAASGGPGCPVVGASPGGPGCLVVAAALHVKHVPGTGGRRPTRDGHGAARHERRPACAPPAELGTWPGSAPQSGPRESGPAASRDERRRPAGGGARPLPSATPWRALFVTRVALAPQGARGPLTRKPAGRSPSVGRSGRDPRETRRQHVHRRTIARRSRGGPLSPCAPGRVPHAAPGVRADDPARSPATRVPAAACAASSAWSCGPCHPTRARGARGAGSRPTEMRVPRGTDRTGGAARASRSNRQAAAPSRRALRRGTPRPHGVAPVCSTWNRPLLTMQDGHGTALQARERHRSTHADAGPRTTTLRVGHAPPRPPHQASDSGRHPLQGRLSDQESAARRTTPRRDRVRRGVRATSTAACSSAGRAASGGVVVRRCPRRATPPPLPGALLLRGTRGIHEGLPEHRVTVLRRHAEAMPRPLAPC